MPLNININQMKRHSLKLLFLFFLALFLAFPTSGILAACSFQAPSTAPLTPVCGANRYQTTDVLLFCGGYPQGNQICCCDNVQTGSGGTGEADGPPNESNGGLQVEPSAPVVIDNPLGGIDTPQKLIGSVINAALGILGSIALLMFIYGGLMWLTSGGNEQQVAKGRNVILWATVGLIIIFTSYALVRFVIFGLGA